MHDAPNVIVSDSSVFPTSGAFNPTLTIMAVALRSATALAHGDVQARRGPLPLDPRASSSAIPPPA
jgi:choline dehydrogenase-like flavoprotein